MHRASLLVTLLVLLVSARSSPSPDLDVRVAGGRVTVRAREIPVSEILERVCEQLGADLVYEGPRPSPLVTVDLEDVPEAEIPGRVLEGLGLNYALQADASGRRLETLIVGETFGTGPATARRGGGRPSPPFREPDDDYGGADDASGEPPDALDFPPSEPGQNPEDLSVPPQFPTDASSPDVSSPFFPAPVFPGDPSHPRPGW